MGTGPEEPRRPSDPTADRRAPVARYVQFHDEATQARFIEAAEQAYRVLLAIGRWGGTFSLAIPSQETVVERRGLFRRAHASAAPPRVLSVAAGLAEAGKPALEVPDRIDALGGCEAGRLVARSMADVLLELITDLAKGSAEEQLAHPAYRQTQRLAAELAALHEVTLAVGCTDPYGCVSIRPPEHWGRREEDVEVAEVRAVLRQLAENAARQQ